MKRIKIKIKVLCLILGIGLTGLLSGCSTTTSVHVLNQDEVILLRKGDKLEAPYNGTFYSENAENRVMNAKIANVKLK